MTKWITAICAMLGLVIAWGQAQPQICGANWWFPFCLRNAAASTPPHADARQQPVPPPAIEPPPPCPALVEATPAQAPHLIAPAGPGSTVDVVFTISADGSADVHSVSGYDTFYNDLAVAFVRQSRWPTYAGGNCNAPYLAHHTVMFPTYADTKPDDYQSTSATSYSQDSSPEAEPIPSTIEFERLNQRAIARFYPARALDRGINGRVELDCIVLASRRLDCAPTFESPHHENFADAALRVAATVRVRDDDRGFPIGARFTLPVRFQIEDVERGPHF